MNFVVKQKQCQTMWRRDSVSGKEKIQKEMII